MSMNYADIRDKVFDGDIAFFRGTTLLSAAIQRVTKSPISHIGMLFWDGDLLMLHEAVDEGCRAIRMSAKVATCKEPVIVARSRFVDSAVKRIAIRRQSNYDLAVEYNWYALLQIYARVRLGIGRKPKFDNRLICSEYVARAYAAAGHQFQALNPKLGFVSPADIFCDPTITEIGTIERQIELPLVEF